ncbi:MAG: methylenetetrahydrofolate reductase [NAD(P)H], partial [Steroidobacteraceae bacterium]
MQEIMSVETHKERIVTALDNITAPVQVSFEFFPPNDVKMEETLWSSVQRLAPLKPRFVSVTYGADGSTRERTHNIVTRIIEETPLTAVPHLTCINASRDEVLAVASSYWSKGIRHLVALRGDPAPGTKFAARPDGFAYAVDLVKGLKQVGDFELSVAAYPESHPEAPSTQFDLDYLKAKIDAGATRAITQFFFDTDTYLRFRDKCVKAGITASIVPGILPITRFPQMQRFAQRCGTAVPISLAERFAGLDDDVSTHQMISFSFAIEQVQKLQ